MDLWKGRTIHPLSHAHKLYKKHIVSKDLVTHKKKKQAMSWTHMRSPRLFHDQAKRLAIPAN